MEIIKSACTPTIDNLRSALYQKLTAPIDAMWEILYIRRSQHYLIKEGDQTWGYCCINDDGCLLQLFLKDAHHSKMNKVVVELIKTNLVTSASLSSKEPLAFNACLFHSKSIKPNTFCFEHANIPVTLQNRPDLRLVSTEDIPSVKAFLKTQVGMDDTFGYTENLVERKEIFLLKEADTIIATSECRMSDTQPEIADLGIIVNRNYQSKGIATQIMQMQVNNVLRRNRRPICSTTVDNIASKRVIEKSGFYCSNIIFDISFTV